MSASKPSRKPSLVDPDFSGFWDSVWLGRENDLISQFHGFIAQLLFVGAWMFGGTFPFWILTLIYLRCYITLSVLIGLMSYSFVFEVGPWPWAVRTVIIGGSYCYGGRHFVTVLKRYEGGASLNFEMPPDGFEKKHSKDPSKQQPSVLTMHPHGIFTQGAVLNSGLRYFAVKGESPEMIESYLGKRANGSDVFGPQSCNYCLCADAIQWLPIFRDMLVNWTDKAALPCNKKFTVNRMKQSLSMGLLPGGFYEASFLEYGKEQIYILKVKGFIKYCLQHGYRVIPGYTFGECRTFRNLMSVSGSLKKWLGQRKLPAVIPVGCWWIPMLPMRNGVGIHTVHSYGKVLPKIEHPTQEQIDFWHDWYVSEVKAIFDRNKWRFGMENEQLHVW